MNEECEIKINIHYNFTYLPGMKLWSSESEELEKLRGERGSRIGK
jgi:hypothetical protein